jgi:hypothetical protein
MVDGVAADTDSVTETAWRVSTGGSDSVGTVVGVCGRFEQWSTVPFASEPAVGVLASSGPSAPSLSLGSLQPTVADDSAASESSAIEVGRCWLDAEAAGGAPSPKMSPTKGPVAAVDANRPPTVGSVPDASSSESSDRVYWCDCLRAGRW